MNSQIVYLNVRSLVAHPDNPRKDLGDLTELAESIRQKGVMQNLTVVPMQEGYCTSCRSYMPSSPKLCARDDVKNERPPCSKWESGGKYTIVIGHRRAAAAKLAGVETVPCIISEMDPREQIETMLLENMQRSDLTIYEQACGFQMMLNFGASVEEVAQRTGFSESTVRRRVKLMEMDGEKLKEASGRQISIYDLDKLAQIEDLKERNRVLGSIGTNDFNMSYQSAINIQNAKRNLPLVVAELKGFAKKIDSKSATKYEYVSQHYIRDWSEGSTIPKKNGEYFYEIEDPDRSYATVRIYTNKTRKAAEKRTQEEIDREKQIRAREAELQMITEQAFELRKSFILETPLVGVRKEDLISMLAKAAFYSKHNYNRMFDDRFIEAGWAEKTGERDDFRQECFIGISKDPLRAALVCTWAFLGDEKTNGYNKSYYGGNSYPAHYENSQLNMLYDFLIKIGYRMSDVENQLRDGTHPAFCGEEVKDA